MKQILEARSNAYYVQPENAKEFELKAYLEIVIIHTDGKKYEVKGKSLIVGANMVESRFICDSEQLASLINDLQMHQKKFQGITQNAEKLTGLVKYMDSNETK